MENKGNSYSKLYWTVCILSILIAFFLSGIFSGKGYLALLTPYCITIILTCFLESAAKSRKLPVFDSWFSVIVMCSGFFISILLLSLSTKFPISLIWMIGGIIIGGLLHPYLGAGFHFVFSYLYCSLNDNNLEQFIYFLLIGCVMCLLAGYMKNITAFFYVIMITCSMHIIFLFVLNQFILQESITRESLLSVAAGGILLFFVFLLKQTYAPVPIFVKDASQEGRREENLKKDLKDTVFVNSQLPAEESAKGITASMELSFSGGPASSQGQAVYGNGKEEDLTPSFDYRTIITSDAPLLKRLNDTLPGIYRHSLLISLLSEKAVNTINGNGLLAKAAGMYHEIGRINEGDYVEQGVLLAREYHFPEELVQILAEQNFRQTKPSSKESAVVMLTDTIIATIKYFEKEGVGKRPSSMKLIEDIFDVRLGQGGLDQSGLSLSDYKVLKEFYHSNIPKTEQKWRKNDDSI